MANSTPLPLDKNRQAVAAGRTIGLQSITADGTWQAVTLAGECKGLLIQCRTDNDSDVFTHIDEEKEIKFSDTAAGTIWIHGIGIELSVFGESGDTIGYVKAASGDTIVILRLA